MAIDKGVKEMIHQLKINNEFQRQLLKEKIEDEKPSERLADQIPEIVADSEFLKKQIKSDQDIDRKDQTDALIKVTNVILMDTFKINMKFQAETLNILQKEFGKFTPSLEGIRKKIDPKKRDMDLGKNLDKVAHELRERQKSIFNTLKAERGEDKKLRIAENKKSQQLEQKNDKKNTARHKEGKKDEENKNKNFLEKQIEGFTEPITELKESFSGIFDGILGKAGIATIFTLIVTYILATYKPFADFVATGLNLIAGTFEGVGSLFRGEGTGDIAKVFEENLAGTIAALTAVGLLFGRFAAKMAIVFYKLIAIPILIFNVVEDVVGRIMRAMEMDLNPGGYIGAFIDGVIMGLFDGLKHIMNLLFDFLLPSDIAESFKNTLSAMFDFLTKSIAETNPFATLGNFLYEKTAALFNGDTEGKAMGGSVAAGTPYIVGEQGAELFVPGAAGTILPAGSFGGMGGNIVVNNNQVNQSATSANHQHANITLVDRQQEQVGL